MSGFDPAPAAAVDAAGAPRFGLFVGEVPVGDLGARTSSMERFFSEKRWRYFAVFSPEVAAGGAIVEAGYLTSAFLWSFDRAARRLYEAERYGLPRPVGNGDVRLGGVELTGPAAALSVRGKLHDVDVKAELSGGAPVTRVAPVRGGGRVNVTTKLAGARAEGWAKLDGRRVELTGAFGVVDFTHGLLGRETSWLWAAAAGRADGGGVVGFNLAAGINDEGATENVLWIAGEPVALPPVSFHFDAASLDAPWRIRSAEGTVDLEFRPEGVRRADVRLPLLQSRYVQPIGTFSGTLRVGGAAVTLRDVPGVTEEHHARW